MIMNTYICQAVAGESKRLSMLLERLRLGVVDEEVINECMENRLLGMMGVKIFHADASSTSNMGRQQRHTR